MAAGSLARIAPVTTSTWATARAVIGASILRSARERCPQQFVHRVEGFGLYQLPAALHCKHQWSIEHRQVVGTKASGLALPKHQSHDRRACSYVILQLRGITMQAQARRQSVEVLALALRDDRIDIDGHRSPLELLP